MSAYKKAIIALVAAHVIWGASTPFIKLSLAHLDPFVMTFVRFWVTSVVLVGILVIRGEALFPIAPKDRLRVILWGLFTVTLNITFFFWGLAYTTAIDASLIGNLVPVLTLVGAHFFAHERLPKTGIYGLAIAFAGSLVIIGSPIFSVGVGDGHRFFGNILNLLASISWVVGTIIMRDIARTYKALTLTTIAFVMGTFLVFPIALIQYVSHPFVASELTFSSYFGVAYSVIGNSILAYTLFNYALRTVTPTLANVFSYIMPIVGTAIAIPLLGETITPVFVFGSALIVVGVFLTETRHPLHPLYRLLHKSS